MIFNYFQSITPRRTWGSSTASVCRTSVLPPLTLTVSSLSTVTTRDRLTWPASPCDDDLSNWRGRPQRSATTWAGVVNANRPNARVYNEQWRCDRTINSNTDRTITLSSDYTNGCISNAKMHVWWYYSVPVFFRIANK